MSENLEIGTGYYHESQIFVAYRRAGQLYHATGMPGTGVLVPDGAQIVEIGFVQPGMVLIQDRDR